ncbi:SDR family oxidoreductase [Aestuariivirga litoralis]|uniref:SDR family oxidoreductase n=1 Tax=Aestuariivirga litoralis TaxID=2650924 RepID=UPI0018C7DC1A|nr:SDR family oxidoreductase [Aestuariivirga litoralis]MBG1231152.1 SDR family oxidoreductase [Aestuariivirga litoralis]
MTDFSNTPVTIIGASRGLGRTLVQTFHELGAQVLAVARGQKGLDALTKDFPGIATLALDAAAPDAPARVFAKQTPRVLILCGGTVPPCAPLPEMSWEDFSANWNADTRMSFQFLQAALKAPLPAGATVLTVTSGAMLNGSPISGGYAGAKKMQHFLSGYAQKEAGRAGLDLRFLTLSPARLIPGTDVGNIAVSSYSKYNGTTEAEFLAAMGPKLTTQNAADAVLGLLKDASPGGNFAVSLDGVTALA